MQDDITMLIESLRAISRNDGSNFIGSRKIIPSTISTLTEVKLSMDISMLFWTLCHHDLICLFVDIDIRVMVQENVMQFSESFSLKVWIAACMNISCLLRIIYVELSIARVLP